MDPVAAVLLAGGESKRFGRDKAEVLLGLVIDALPRRSETVLVLRAGQVPKTTRVDRVIMDDMALPDGPLRGIVSGLEVLEQDWAWVLACDLPGVSPKILQELLKHRRSGALGVIPEWEGRLEPLCALYSRTAARYLRRAIEMGAQSVQEALQDPRFVHVPESRLRELDPTGRSFTNINTPQALEQFRSSE